MAIRVLSRSDLDGALDARAAVEAMRSAFAQLSAHEATVPIRSAIESALGVTLLMPAWLGRTRELGAKIVSVFPENAARGVPAVQGAVLLLDGETGRALALLDGTRLTAIRTAAGSALATELLADSAATVLTVFGAGTQAHGHIELFAALRPLTEVRIVSRTRERAERLAAEVRSGRALGLGCAGDRPPEARVMDDPARALEGVRLVVTATTSRRPVFAGRDLEAGAHVNAVGSYRPDMQEIDAELLGRARIVVDQREAAWEETGDLLVPLERGVIGRDAVDAELGDIVTGATPGGRAGREVTLFESVGNAAQDVAIAASALRAAERLGLGVEAPF